MYRKGLRKRSCVCLPWTVSIFILRRTKWLNFSMSWPTVGRYFPKDVRLRLTAITVAMVSKWLLAMIVLRSIALNVVTLQDWTRANLLFPSVDSDVIFVEGLIVLRCACLSVGPCCLVGRYFRKRYGSVKKTPCCTQFNVCLVFAGCRLF